MTIRVAHVVPAVRIGGILHHLRAMTSLPPQFQSICVSLFDADDEEAIAALKMATVRLRLPLEQYDDESMISSHLDRALVGFAPTLVHTHHIFSDWYAVPAARRLGIKVVRSVHGISQRDSEEPLVCGEPKFDWSLVERSRQLALEPWLSRTLAVSEDLRMKLLSYGFPADKVGLLYPGISPVMLGACTLGWKKSQQRDSAFHIVFPHRIEPIKNPDILIDIVGALVQNGIDVRLFLPRVGTRVRHVEELIRNEALDQHFVWLPRTADIWKEIPDADAFLLTSMSEGLPVTVLEAMLQSIPVVSSRVGGIPEVVAHTEMGFLVDATDIGGYVHALQTLALDQTTRFRVGAAGRSRVLSVFGLEQHLQNLAQCYEAVCSA